MNPYCRLCPVFQSRTISTLLIGPKRENITSRSRSCVIGLSLQMNRMVSRGFTLASGRSPRIYNVKACFFAFWILVASSISSSIWHFSSIYRCSIASRRSESLLISGLAGGGSILAGSGKGSATMNVCNMRMFICGRFLSST